MNIYKDYAKTRLQIKTLTNKLRDLEGNILKEMQTLSAPMKNEFGTYSSVTRTVVKLSQGAIEKQQKVKEKIKTLTDPLKEKIKNIEEKDIKSGNAKKEEVVGLRFTETKNE